MFPSGVSVPGADLVHRPPPLLQWGGGQQETAGGLDQASAQEADRDQDCRAA